MRNLTPRWMLIKAGLFVVLAVLAAAILIAACPSWTTVACTLVVAWASSRAYYFAFYVVQHYVDPSYRFSGLGSFVLWLHQQRRTRRHTSHHATTRRPAGGP